jgi:hypothetical protein
MICTSDMRGTEKPGCKNSQKSPSNRSQNPLLDPRFGGLSGLRHRLLSSTPPAESSREASRSHPSPSMPTSRLRSVRGEMTLTSPFGRVQEVDTGLTRISGMLIRHAPSRSVICRARVKRSISCEEAPSKLQVPSASADWIKPAWLRVASSDAHFSRAISCPARLRDRYRGSPIRASTRVRKSDAAQIAPPVKWPTAQNNGVTAAGCSLSIPGSCAVNPAANTAHALCMPLNSMQHAPRRATRYVLAGSFRDASRWAGHANLSLREWILIECEEPLMVFELVVDPEPQPSQPSQPFQ